METAHKRDGILNQKFWWKTNNSSTNESKTLRDSNYLKSSEVSATNSSTSLDTSIE